MSSRSNPPNALAVAGFDGDTIVRARARRRSRPRRGVEPRWRARIEKRIPVAAGLGGGSSDAATALRLANEMLAGPAHRCAAAHARRRPRRGRAVLPHARPTARHRRRLDARADRTAAGLHRRALAPARRGEGVDRRGLRRLRSREPGFDEALLPSSAVPSRRATSRALPANDLASSRFAVELADLGAFRADVSGAGPAVYGLFRDAAAAKRAAAMLEPAGRTWITRPSW